MSFKVLSASTHLGSPHFWIFLFQKQAESEELVCVKKIPLAQSTKTSSPVKGRLRSGRNTVNLGMCQDEPELLDDWNRIAELQRRNQACPLHLKTSYPLESMPSTSLGTITDEDVKMGDPEETLRRGSMQPSQIIAARREAGSQASSITTRQQKKRLSEETHQGLDTPPSKRQTRCFPRPQTAQDRSEQSGSQVSQESEQPAPATQAQRRQSMAFTILNTPRELGRRLLRRAATQRSTPTPTPTSSGTRRSSRIATAKSPKGKASRQSRKDKQS